MKRANVAPASAAVVFLPWSPFQAGWFISVNVPRVPWNRQRRADAARLVSGQHRPRAEARG